jgi:hypothetical protein
LFSLCLFLSLKNEFVSVSELQKPKELSLSGLGVESDDLTKNKGRRLLVGLESKHLGYCTEEGKQSLLVVVLCRLGVGKGKSG